MPACRTLMLCALGTALLACSIQKGPRPGDRVVARLGESFREGTVLEARGNLVMVGWDEQPPERSGVPRGWVVFADASAAGASPGDLLLCRQDRRFVPCTFSAASDGHVDVQVEGRAVRLRAREVLPVPPALTEWTAELAARRVLEAARADRLRTLADVIPASAGEPVAEDSEVVARWPVDQAWYGARVTAAFEGRVTVRWKDGSGPEELPAAEVAPRGEPAATEVGAAAMCLWRQSGANAAYFPALVEGGHEGTLQVAWTDGTTGLLPAGDCVPARPPEKAPRYGAPPQ